MSDAESLTKGKARVLADQYGCSTAYAEAYIEGEYCRRVGGALGPYQVVGMDEYSSGFRAGYFGRLPSAALATKEDERAIR